MSDFLGFGAGKASPSDSSEANVAATPPVAETPLPAEGTESVEAGELSAQARSSGQGMDHRDLLTAFALAGVSGRSKPVLPHFW